MTKIDSVRGTALTGVLVVLAGMSAPSAARAADATENWEAMTKCAAIADNDKRHQCSDDVLTRAGLLGSPEARAAEIRRGFGLQNPPPASKQRAEAKPKPTEAKKTKEERSEVKKAKEERSKPKKSDDHDRIDVTLAVIGQAGPGKFIFKTTDGAIWRQLESDTYLRRPAAGDSMNIRKNALGGFLCKIGKAPSFRCKQDS